MKVTISSLPGRSVSQSGRDNIFSRFSVSQSVSQSFSQSGSHMSWAPWRFLFHFISLIYDFRHISFISPSAVFFLYHTVISSFVSLEYSFFYITQWYIPLGRWFLILLFFSFLYHTVIYSFGRWIYYYITQWYLRLCRWSILFLSCNAKWKWLYTLIVPQVLIITPWCYTFLESLGHCEFN